MARDYGKTGSRRHNSSRNRGAAKDGIPPGWKWLLLGLLIGLLLGAIFYLKQQPSGNLEAGLKGILVKKDQTKVSTSSKTKSPKNTKKVTAQADIPQPRFDFYTILPKVKVPVTKTAKSPHNAPPLKKPVTEKKSLAEANTAQIDNNLTSKTQKIEPVLEKGMADKPVTQYVLQIASLSHYSDADQLRAQLVLLGFDTHIKTIQNNGATYNRVWLGPYATTAEAMNMQKRLQENKVKSVMLKAA